MNLEEVAAEAERIYQEYRRMNYVAMLQLHVDQKSSLYTLEGAYEQIKNYPGLALLRENLAKWIIEARGFKKRGT